MLALNRYAKVRAGHPFRSGVAGVPSGNAYVVQMKDVAPERAVDWGALTRTRLATRREPDWLGAGDILFAARGTRNFAFCLDEVPVPAVCSPHFFLLRVLDPQILRPDFLAWQINQLPAQRYFAERAEGSGQLSIRRGILEALPILVPALAIQEKAVSFSRAVQQERCLLEGLIRNRQQQADAFALGLLRAR